MIADVCTKRAADAANEILKEDGIGSPIVICLDYRNYTDVILSIRGEPVLSELTERIAAQIQELIRSHPQIYHVNYLGGSYVDKLDA